MTSFSQLGLSDPILRVLSDLGFENPTNIQEQAIPLLLEAPTDFIGMAQTGTGKTAAFGLPLLDRVDSKIKHTQALILAPTRELVQQIGLQLEAFSRFMPSLKLITVYGGAPIQKQIQSIREKSPHIVLATPGRLMDLMKRKVINLSSIQTLILDEADEMLNMGFKEDIDAILKFTPEECRTWLFSATMPSEIREIIKNYMDSPKEVKIQPKSLVNEDIAHHYYLVNRNDKTEALVRILDSQPDMVGIIFCRTKIDTQKLADDLTGRGYLVEAIHGDLNQNQRDRVMGKFKAHKVKLLTATDVAARGIDVKNLTHVIHHSLPDDAEYYTHRSGRTARGGQKGISLALATRGDVRKIEQISKKLKVGIKKLELPSTADISQQRISTWIDSVKSAKESTDAAVIEEVEAQLATLSKSDLLKKLVTLEVDKMNLNEIKLEEPGAGDYGDGDGFSKKRRRNRSGGGGKGSFKSHHGGKPEKSYKKKKKSDGQGGQQSDGSGKRGRSKRFLSRRRG